MVTGPLPHFLAVDPWIRRVLVMSTSRPTGASALALLLLPSAALTAGSVATPATPAQQTQVPATLNDFFLPGTQPNELNQPIFETSKRY